jgi:hypothetical protein
MPGVFYVSATAVRQEVKKAEKMIKKPFRLQQHFHTLRKDPKSMNVYRGTLNEENT